MIKNTYLCRKNLIAELMTYSYKYSSPMLTKCLILCKFKMRHDDNIDTCAFLIVKVDRFRILYTTIGKNKILTIIILLVYLFIVPDITCLYRYFVKL